MRKIARPLLLLLSLKNELYGLACMVVTMMMLVSLISYNPHDTSWFYQSSVAQPTTNWCGVVGAYAASLFIFLWGYAAYMCIIFLGCLLYHYVRNGSSGLVWERVGGAFLLLISCATLCTFFFSPIHSISGGLVGFRVATLLYRYLGFVGAYIMLYACVYSSLVLLFQCSLVVLVKQALYGLSRVNALIYRYAVWTRLYNGCLLVIYGIYHSVYLLVRFFVRCINGALIEEVALIEAEQREPHDQTYPRIITAITDRSKDTFIQPSSRSKMDWHDTQPSHDTNGLVTEHLWNNIKKSSDAYGLPNLNIFNRVSDTKEDVDHEEAFQERAHILEEKLQRFGILGKVVSIKYGPVVTLFEYQPAINIKLSKILSLEDDLALALKAHNIRILAPIPGRSVVGFEVSNNDRKEVSFSSVIQSQAYMTTTGALPLVLGKDTVGNDVVVDLAVMPHLLVAGSTGSGKSVALNAMLMSLLCKKTPAELRLVLIDPKRLEFSMYADIAHLLFPIVTQPKKAVLVLRWVVQEMDTRYERMAECGAKNIMEYNAKTDDVSIPYIVVVIDELSDLMLTVGRDIEDLITRITQMARAAGIHMLVATQRPSVDVITGLIKVNFPSRISFRVTSKVDSRTILDCGGADKLLGKGDMLFLDSSTSLLRRIHGAYVSDSHIHQVVAHIKKQQQVEYYDIEHELVTSESDVAQEDEMLFKEVIQFLDEVDEVSISLLQRKFRIGYNRSARIIDVLESRGLIMPVDGSKTRRVIK